MCFNCYSMVHSIKVVLLVFLLLCLKTMKAQDTTSKKYTLQQIFEQAEAASEQLNISRTAIDIAQQSKAVIEDQKLPSISTALGFSYISNALVWGGHPQSGGTTHLESLYLPHQGTDFNIKANELIYKGGLVKNNIEKADLQEQLATLNYRKNKGDINLLLAGRYLDLMKLYNQQKVIRKHIDLAEKRLSNIQKMHTEGMVTKNDELRVQLQISNLNLSLKEVNNNIAIINTQLAVVLSLPRNVYIIPIEDSITENEVADGVAVYVEKAMQGYAEIKAAEVDKQIAEKNLSIAKTAKIPSVSLFATNTLQRPVLNVLPPIDQYFNFWMAGVTVGFDIGSLYKANKSIDLAKIQLKQQDNLIALQKQHSEIEVNTAYINFNQAKERIVNLHEAKTLAEENYRIMEKKYYNQLALLTDLLDASNSRLDADIQLSNAHISLLYAYYQLQKAIGNLN